MRLCVLCKSDGAIKHAMITEKVKKVKNMIGDGGGSALHVAYAVETVDIVDTVQTAYSVCHVFFIGVKI